MKTARVPAISRAGAAAAATIASAFLLLASEAAGFSAQGHQEPLQPRLGGAQQPADGAPIRESAYDGVRRIGDLPAWMRPVEQGVGDVGPIAESLRLLDIDLRVPSGFTEVYPVPGRDDLYMRIDGGLYVTFPQSLYSEAGALIPNNAVFHIGAPAFLEQEGIGQRPAADYRYDPHSAAMVRESRNVPAAEYTGRPDSPSDSRNRLTPADQADGGPAPSIAVDRWYRTQRLMSLMQRAAVTERALTAPQARESDAASDDDDAHAEEAAAQSDSETDAER